MARIALLHGMAMWPDDITYFLRLNDVRKTCNDTNQVPHTEGNKSPLKTFAGIEVHSELYNNQILVWPVFVLKSSLIGMVVKIMESIVHSSSAALIVIYVHA
jgi:hypothetical protein